LQELLAGVAIENKNRQVVVNGNNPTVNGRFRERNVAAADGTGPEPPPRLGVQDMQLCVAGGNKKLPPFKESVQYPRTSGMETKLIKPDPIETVGIKFGLCEKRNVPRRLGLCCKR
jgi:hypothetical protein